MSKGRTFIPQIVEIVFLGLMLIFSFNTAAYAAPIHDAASNGDISAIQQIIKADPSIVDSRDGGFTPLMLAAKNGQLMAVKYLIFKGADVNSRDNVDGNTPLILAAINKHANVVEILIQNNAGVNITNNKSCSALYTAAKKGSLDVVNILINAGADVRQVNEAETTPLHVANGEFSEEIATVLIKHGARVDARNKYGNTPLFFAAKYNRTQLASALLENGADVNAEAKFKNENSDVQIYTPLMFASMNGNLAAAEILVRSGAEIDKSDLGKENALSLAVKKRHLDVAEYLLKHKSNVNVRIGCTEYNPNGGYTLLYWACSNNDMDAARLLIQYGCAVNENKEHSSPLAAAASCNNLELVKLLVENGATIDISSDGYSTTSPLYYASINGNIEMVKYFLDQGADINMDNSAPLRGAAERGDFHVAKFLIENGAEVNPGNISLSWMPLHEALAWNHFDVAWLLWTHGAKLHANDIYGWIVFQIVSTVLLFCITIIALIALRHKIAKLFLYLYKKCMAPFHRGRTE